MSRRSWVVALVVLVGIQTSIAGDDASSPAGAPTLVAVLTHSRFRRAESGPAEVFWMPGGHGLTAVLNLGDVVQWSDDATRLWRRSTQQYAQVVCCADGDVIVANGPIARVNAKGDVVATMDREVGAYHMALSPDQRTLVDCDADPQPDDADADAVVFRDARDLAEERRIRIPGEKSPASLAFDADGKTLYWTTRDNALRGTSVAEPGPVRTFAQFEDLWCIHWELGRSLGPGRFLVRGFSDKEQPESGGARLLEVVGDKATLGDVVGATRGATCVDADPDGNVYFGTRNGTISVVGRDGTKPARVVAKVPESVDSTRTTPRAAASPS